MFNIRSRCLGGSGFTGGGVNDEQIRLVPGQLGSALPVHKSGGVNRHHFAMMEPVVAPTTILPVVKSA